MTVVYPGGSFFKSCPGYPHVKYTLPPNGCLSGFRHCHQNEAIEVVKFR